MSCSGKKFGIVCRTKSPKLKVLREGKMFSNFELGSSEEKFFISRCSALNDVRKKEHRMKQKTEKV